jgi:ribose transport system permease protein
MTMSPESRETLTATSPAATPAAASPDSYEGGAPVRRATGMRVPEFAALLAFLIIMCSYFSLTTPQFLTWGNVVNILDAVAVIAIVAAPVTMLMVAGQLDLSVGSALGLAAVLMVVTANEHGLLAGVAVAVATGIAVGLINGFFVTVIGVNALITTLGMLALLLGAAELVSDGQTVGITGFETLGTARPFAGVPIPVLIFVVITILFWLLMRYTVLGRSMYATGANASAARLVGIRSNRNIVIAFVLIGACVALSALITVSEIGAASHNNGRGLELAVITAVVLGGTSLAGGRGTVPGTLVGVLIIGVLNNGLVLKNVDPFWQDVARGALLLFARTACALSSASKPSPRRSGLLVATLPPPCSASRSRRRRCWRRSTARRCGPRE